ncbi:hypothetical protein F5Y04DRAFT_282214 [Hypomontagnella monticulosa]|nr:hypothetical protein F5Y04DRAFT_282214 [Hypomontagnella monticulosa]
MAKQKIPKSTALLPTSRPKGVINFFPFERLDEESLRQVRKFRVHPFGNIQDHSRHIPYNSTKKDFFEKTSRESFEVFQYDFKVPGDETEYTVMWDYNVGLVRMTPFFKCCKYPKTTPAKMLNLNPGLKEITHSITGGSIMAQGYWMPYQCAKAVCATFCHNIAGALIPIFGPDFPGLCAPSEAPEYGRMVIDQNIVIQTAREAEHFRRLYSNALASSTANGGSGGRVSPIRDRRHIFRGFFDDPRQSHQHPHPHQQHHHHHYRRPPIRRTFPTPDTPYATDTDSDMSPVVAEQRGSIGHHEHVPYSPLPLPQPHQSLRPTSNGWTPANAVLSPQHHHHSHPHPHYEAQGPSPWLSAVPRFTTAAHIPPYQLQPQSRPPHQQPQQHPPQPWRGGSKRPAEHVEGEYEYAERHRGSSVSNGTNRTITAAPLTAIPIIRDNRTSPREDPYNYGKDKPPSAATEAAITDPTAVPGADKNAALLLMNLSFRDARGRGSGAAATATVDGTGARAGDIVVVSMSEASSPSDVVFPRIKRVRANST